MIRRGLQLAAYQCEVVEQRWRQAEAGSVRDQLVLLAGVGLGMAFGAAALIGAHSAIGWIAALAARQVL